MRIRRGHPLDQIGGRGRRKARRRRFVVAFISILVITAGGVSAALFTPEPVKKLILRTLTEWTRHSNSLSQTSSSSDNSDTYAKTSLNVPEADILLSDDPGTDTFLSDGTVTDFSAASGSQPADATVEDPIEAARQKALAAGCPSGIVALLDKNSETLQFVSNYAEKKDLPPAEQISDWTEGILVPHLLQWDERWGYQPYGSGTIAVNGCGPTCMSMVVAGLTGDRTATPYQMAVYGNEHGLVNLRGETSWDFMTKAAKAWGLAVSQAAPEESLVRQELSNGHPIICRVGPGYFTSGGHFIVLTGYADGYVTVNDPFSIENSGKFWLYSDIEEQITQMWIYSFEPPAPPQAAG